MEREIAFAEKLQKIRETAKDQGNMVTEAQIKEAFAEFELGQEQFDMIHDYLQKHRVGIGEPMDTEEYLTDEEKNFLQIYLDEIKEIDVVSDGERQAIFLSAMAGDQNAQNRLIHLILPQVADIAKLYAGQGVFMEDLIGEGNVAVTMGVQMLGAYENAADAERGLIQMMMEAMETFIAENAEEDKRDKHIADKVNKVADAAKKLAEEYGRKVTSAELAAETTLSVKMIEDAQRISGNKIEDLEQI